MINNNLSYKFLTTKYILLCWDFLWPSRLCITSNEKHFSSLSDCICLFSKYILSGQSDGSIPSAMGNLHYYSPPYKINSLQTHLEINIQTELTMKHNSGK